MGAFQKFVQNFKTKKNKKNYQSYQNSVRDKNCFFFDLLQLVLNFHEDRFNNKKFFSRVYGPLKRQMQR